MLLKDVAGNERAEARLRNALIGVSRGTKLTSQLLAFGRRQSLAPKVVNLGRLIRGMDDMLEEPLAKPSTWKPSPAAGFGIRLSIRCRSRRRY